MTDDIMNPSHSRWRGIKRDYSAADVAKLAGSVRIQHTLADRGARKLWDLLNNEPFVQIGRAHV